MVGILFGSCGISGKLFSAFQDISYATYCLDQAGSTWRVLDFLPQISYVYFYDIRFTEEIVAPYAVEDCLAIQDLAWVAHKQVQEVVLGGRQFDETPGTAHFTGGHV